MKTNFEITLEDFKGPLDLLLHLLEKNKVDIYDIPIVDITKQYIDFIEKSENKLTVASEFLVMASTLISIKTRMLLPKHEEDEKDPRTELVEQLLEYKYFKEISQQLKLLEENGQKAIVKSETLPAEVKKFEFKPDIDELFKDVDIVKLKNIFEEALKRADERIDQIRHNFSRIEEDTWTVEQSINNIRDNFKTKNKFKLSNLLSQTHSKLHLVVTFLAILEMIKFGEIKIKFINYDDIEVIGG